MELAWLMALGISTLWSVVPAEAAPATAPAPAPAAATAADAVSLPYVRLYTDAKGISHFADEHLVLTPAGAGATPEERLFINRLGDLQGVLFARLKAGVTEDWHVAPRRQFMLCVHGSVKITAGDGEVRRMNPGQFMLLEDTSGRGHRTHAAGDEDHVALALPVPEGVPAR
jgi:quercetin dioxygenase-like cupin family protein